MKLIFKLTSLVPRISHVYIYVYFIILVKTLVGNCSFNLKTKAAIDNYDFIF